MTITRMIRKRLRRYALYCLMAATTAGLIESARPTLAEEIPDDQQLCGWIEELSETTFNQQPKADVVETEIQQPQFFSVSIDKELVIDTCSYDDWLAQQLAADDAADVDSTTESPGEPSLTARSTPSRTSSEFNSTLATIAASATAGNPVPFAQWTEPFALVGPDGKHTLEDVAAFQAWFDSGKQFVEDLRSRFDNGYVPVVDFEGEIDSNTSPSVVVDQEQPVAEQNAVAEHEVIVEKETDPNPVDTSSMLVGSSPMIYTIEETYQSYDPPVADNDPEPSDEEKVVVNAVAPVIWGEGILDPQHHPICIRSLIVDEEPNWSPLEPARKAWAGELVQSDLDQQDTDSNVETIDQTAAADVADTQAEDLSDDSLLTGSVDCLMGELIWKVSVILEDVSISDPWLRPKRLGHEMASLVVSGDRMVSRLASELGQAWPVPPAVAEPIRGSGVKLLARAEAVERPAAERATDESLDQAQMQAQLAQVSAKLRQWVDVTQKFVRDWNRSFEDVAEVAQNRGTQDESKKR